MKYIFFNLMKYLSLKNRNNINQFLIEQKKILYIKVL